MSSFSPPPALREFISADQTITLGAPLTVPHGFGVLPRFVFPFWKSLATQNGYVNGDFFQVNDLLAGASAGRGQVITWDATNIYVRFGSSSGFNILDKTTGNDVFVTTFTNWRFFVKVYA